LRWGKGMGAARPFPSPTFYTYRVCHSDRKGGISMLIIPDSQ
jgi:hypothetical protein